MYVLEGLLDKIESELEGFDLKAFLPKETLD
jgi:hypothetical protein